MPIIEHKHCGGFVSQKTGKCDKCGRRWNLVNLWFNPGLFRKQLQIVHASRADIARKMVERHKKSSYASWADRLPGVGAVASALPNWSRKTRILAFIIFIVIIGLVITAIFGGF
jgi:hypothetical protein